MTKGPHTLTKVVVNQNEGLRHISDILTIIDSQYELIFDINNGNIPSIKEEDLDKEMGVIRTSVLPNVPYEYSNIQSYIAQKIDEEGSTLTQGITTVIIKSSDEFYDFINTLLENGDKFNSIETIIANNLNLGNNGILQFSRLFDDPSRLSHLKKLELRSNDIGSTGFVSLMNGLANRNSNVSKMNRWFGKTKCKNEVVSNLESLNIGMNRVKTQGTIFLFNLMAQGKFPNLLELDLSANCLDDGAMDAFMKLLKDCQSNKINIPAQFVLGNNPISKKKGLQVRQFIQENLEQN
ncbi:hypothetical protein WA158_003752 [Blastocystis sp. Blastoise]